ncbi:Pro-Pol polyprotein [Portunus trituberculatus]|uniref:Pro-Pol polyprotein n=1 Tax=Portunus trituberculatus TaxID=210409 RepID=A0A5B7G576_PORTR|nr:Pro-Pol polyprotein [Portunus trituberculatus]
MEVKDTDVFTIVDNFSRFVKLYPLKSKRTHGIIEALEQCLTDLGTPQSIILDKRGEFTSQAFKDFCQQNLITLYYTTPCHSQGITEGLHRILKSILAALCQGHHLLCGGHDCCKHARLP